MNVHGEPECIRIGALRVYRSGAGNRLLVELPAEQEHEWKTTLEILGFHQMNVEQRPASNGRARRFWIARKHPAYTAKGEWNLAGRLHTDGLIEVLRLGQLRRLRRECLLLPRIPL